MNTPLRLGVVLSTVTDATLAEFTELGRRQVDRSMRT